MQGDEERKGGGWSQGKGNESPPKDSVSLFDRNPKRKRSHLNRPIALIHDLDLPPPSSFIDLDFLRFSTVPPDNDSPSEIGRLE